MNFGAGAWVSRSLVLARSRSLGDGLGIPLSCLQERRAKRSHEATVAWASVFKIGFRQPELCPFREEARRLVRMKKLGFAYLPIVVEAHSPQAWLCWKDASLFQAPFAGVGPGREA